MMAVVAPEVLPARRAPSAPLRQAGLDASLEPEPDTDGADLGVSPTALTIAMVGDAGTPSAATNVVARLAELAVTDELLMVYEVTPHGSGAGVRAVVAGLRVLVPRHAVVALHITEHSGFLARDASLLDNLLDLGTVPMVVTTAEFADEVTAEISDRLGADRVLRMSQTPDGGAELAQVWHRAGGIEQPREPLADSACVRCAA